MGYGIPPPDQRVSTSEFTVREVKLHGTDLGLSEAFRRTYFMSQGRYEEADQLCPGAYINGGGSAAAWSAGKVVACMEKGLFNGEGFRFVVGNSAGALIMVYAALGNKEAVKMFYEENPKNRIMHLLNIVQRGGLVDYKTFEESLRTGPYALTDIDIARVRNFPIPLIVGVTPTGGEDKGKPIFRDLRNEKDIIKTIIASMKLPVGNIPDVEIDGMLYVDGGLSSPIPLDELLMLYPTSLTMFLNSPFEVGRFEQWVNIQQARIAQWVQHVEISSILANGSRRDKSFARIRSGHSLPPVTVLAPDRPMPGFWGGLFNNHPPDLEAAVMQGYRGMITLLEKIQGYLEFPEVTPEVS